jgi:hypothetical protein
MRASVSRSPDGVQPFLGLDHLVQAALPGAVGHHAAGVFVDDLHLAVHAPGTAGPVEQVQRRQRLLSSLLARAGVGRWAGLDRGQPRSDRGASGRRSALDARAPRRQAHRIRARSTSKSMPWRRLAAEASAQPVLRGAGCRASLEMISGVRASSISTLSASSTMAKTQPAQQRRFVRRLGRRCRRHRRECKGLRAVAPRAVRSRR